MSDQEHRPARSPAQPHAHPPGRPQARLPEIGGRPGLAAILAGRYGAGPAASPKAGAGAPPPLPGVLPLAPSPPPGPGVDLSTAGMHATPATAPDGTMPQRPDVRARLPGPARDAATGNHQGAADVAAGSAPAYPPEPARAAPASPADDGMDRPSPMLIPRAGTAKPPALLGLLARGLPDNVPEDRQGGAALDLPSPLPLLAPPPGAAPAAIAQEGDGDRGSQRMSGPAAAPAPDPVPTAWPDTARANVAPQPAGMHRAAPPPAQASVSIGRVEIRVMAPAQKAAPTARPEPSASLASRRAGIGRL